jgi:hypothetical protein
MAYFNALPSFANPLNTFSQRSFDTRQRLWNADLDLRPGKRLQPFLSVGRQSGNGFGVSPIVMDENSYPAASAIDYGYLQGFEQVCLRCRTVALHARTGRRSFSRRHGAAH